LAELSAYQNKDAGYYRELSYKVAVGCFSLLCTSNSSRELNSMPLHMLHLNGSSIDIVSIWFVFYILLHIYKINLLTILLVNQFRQYRL